MKSTISKSAISDLDVSKYMPKFLPSLKSLGAEDGDIWATRYEELHSNYSQHAYRYVETLGQITAKKILAFKSVKIPTPIAERNVGLILMTLFSAFIDSTIRLTNDKGQLLDKSWTTGVLPYF